MNNAIGLSLDPCRARQHSAVHPRAGPWDPWIQPERDPSAQSPRYGTDGLC